MTISDWNNLGFEDLANCDLDSLKIIYWTINQFLYSSILPLMGSAN